MNTLQRINATDILATLLFAVSGFLLTQSAVAAWQSPMSPVAAGTQGQASVSQVLATSTTSSLNWSGYVAQRGSYTSVTGTWVVPSVNSDSNISSVAADATWVGIGGVSEINLIQAGTQAIIDGQGTIVYQPWLETIPGNSYVIPIDIHPNDSVTTTITEQQTAHWLISLRDNTTGKSYQTTVVHDSSLSSAEWIEEMPSSAYGNFFIPLDQFGMVPFTGGSTIDDGVTKTIAQSGATPLTMTSLEGDQLATTSILGSDGASFSVERTDAQAQMALSDRRHKTYTLYYFSQAAQ